MNNYKPKWKARINLGFFTIIALAAGTLLFAACPSPTGSNPAAPGAPQSFTATPGNAQVTLSWAAPESDGGSEITGYEVSRDNGTTWVDATSNTGHTFTGLTNGTSYTFKVRAVNAAGEGDESTVSSTPYTVPGAPQNFHADPGHQAVDLTWNAPSSTGGSVITVYQVSRSEGEGWTSWVTADSNTEHVFTGLTNDTEYTFRVRAVNAAGPGAESSATATPNPGPPWHPQYFTAIPDNGKVDLSWKVPANDGGDPITKYQVSSDNGTNWFDVTAEVDVDHEYTYTFTSLDNGTEYTFRVRAVNAAGPGAESTEKATPRPNPPTIPQSFSAVPGNAQAELSWTAPADNGGAEIEKYEVSRSDGAGWTSWTDAASNTSHTFTGLTNGTSYTFRVRAVNAAGNGTAASASATPRTIPGEVGNFTATAGNAQVVLTWTEGDDGGSTITGYQVSNDNGSTWVAAETNTSHTFTGLDNGTEYTFKVYAVNVVGDGPESTQTATPDDIYVITGSGTAFTARQADTVIGTADQAIAAVLTAIRTHANTADVTIQFGDGVNNLNIGSNSVTFNNTGGTWGDITLRGAITGNRNGTTVGTVIVTGDITLTSTGSILNSSSDSSVALCLNDFTGTLNISRGLVQGTGTFVGHAIMTNNTTGTINITGGTVQSRSGRAIFVSSSSGATVNISQTSTDTLTIITSDSTGATIFMGNIAAKLTITSGVVRATDNNSNARAIDISNSNEIVISGGTVGAMNTSNVGTSGVAIRNNSNGSITISGSNTLIISGARNSTDNPGTIFLSGGSGSLTVSDGATVENTWTDGTSVAIFSHVNHTGTITTTGGNIVGDIVEE